MNRIYLDNNATTGLDPRVAHAMMDDLSPIPANPSSVHFFGQEAKKRLTRSRQLIAEVFHVKPSEVIFTSGGTESINTLLRGFYALHPKCRIVSSNVEHSCLFGTLQLLEKKGAHVTYLPAGLHGVAQTSQLPDEADLMIFGSVNNETGAQIDLAAFAAFAEERRIPLIIDAVCHLGKEPFRLLPGVSAAVFSGHKIHGPKGIGLTILRKSLKVEPLLTGGEQEQGLRAGTENLSGIIGLAKAIELVQTELPTAMQRMCKLRDRLVEGLMEKIGNIVVHGAAPRICNTANIGFPGADGESLLIQLDLAGIAASHGSACSSGSLEPSRVLLNMEIPRSVVQTSVRFSLSRETTAQEIETTINTIAALLKK